MNVPRSLTFPVLIMLDPTLLCYVGISSGYGGSKTSCPRWHGCFSARDARRLWSKPEFNAVPHRVGLTVPPQFFDSTGTVQPMQRALYDFLRYAF